MDLIRFRTHWRAIIREIVLPTMSEQRPLLRQKILLLSPECLNPHRSIKIRNLSQVNQAKIKFKRLEIYIEIRRSVYPYQRKRKQVKILTRFQLIETNPQIKIKNRFPSNLKNIPS